MLQQSCRLLVQVNLGELATTQFFAPLTRGKKDASGPPRREIFLGAWYGRKRRG